MKRDPQVFAWECVAGVLEIVGRKDGPMEGIRRVYRFFDYPESIRGSITDAGMKAIFQQRSSQVDGDEAKLAYWDSLDAMFREGTWELEGGQRGAPVVAAWVEALAESKNATVGATQAALNKHEKPQRDAIKAKCLVKFATRIAEIEAARREARQAEAIDLSEI